MTDCIAATSSFEAADPDGDGTVDAGGLASAGRKIEAEIDEKLVDQSSTGWLGPIDDTDHSE